MQEMFIKSFVGYKPKIGVSLNILVFGIKGSGKSSFLMGANTVFSSSVQHGIGVVGGDSNHVTQ